MARLFKRGDIYYGWVPKRGGGVRRVSTSCTDQRAASTRLKQLEREAVNPAVAAANAATTQGIVDDYFLSRKRIGRAEGTLHHAKTKLGHLVRLLPARVADIDHSKVEGYVDTRLKEWAAAPVLNSRGTVVREGRHIRRTTIVKELRVLKAALRHAKKNGLFAGDPAAVIPELADDYTPGERVLTPWELIGLASVLKPRRMAVVAFAVATGCDFSALWRARREDVRENASVVHIRGTKRKTRDRDVPIALANQRALVEWALANGDGPDGLLFSHWGNMRRELHEACVKLGIAHFSANDLRRTFGTWLREAGVEPQLIGAAMGHTDSRMVERVYGRLTTDALAKLLLERVSRGAAPVAAPAPQVAVAHRPLVTHVPRVRRSRGLYRPETASLLVPSQVRPENPRVGGSIPPLRTSAWLKRRDGASSDGPGLRPAGWTGRAHHWGATNSRFGLANR
jgi:integrase